MNLYPELHSASARLVLAAALLLAIAGNGCGRKEPQEALRGAPWPPAKPTVVSAEKTSFDEVTAQLDPGGSLYGYLSTSQWLEGLSDRVNGWRDAALSLPDLGSEGRSNVSKAFDLITRLISNSGLESISGVGVSGIALEKGFYQTKFVVQRGTNNPPGGIWTVFGRTPRPLNELDWLPAETVWAVFADLDVSSLWNTFVREVDRSGFAEAKAKLEQVNSAVQQASGKKLDDLFGSLAGQVGAFLTLSATNKVGFPLPTGGTLEFPEPALLMVFKVKDSAIFDWIDHALQANPQVLRSEEGDLQMRTMPVPLPVPIMLRPTIARQGDYLFVASTDELVKSMLAVKAGKQNGLKATAEFKRLAQGMPTDGNSFNFVSQRLGDAVQQIQSAILGQARGQGSEMPAVLLKKMYSLNQPLSSFVVGRSTAQGWLTVAHGTQQPANAIVLPLVIVPTAVMAGITLPALAKAKGRAQSIACVNNLRQMGLAARIYATDHNGSYPPDFPSMKGELPNPLVLFCPADPKNVGRAGLTWADFDPSQSSYEFVTHGLIESTPGSEKKILFRCRIHGNVCTGDGNVVSKGLGAH